MLNVIPLFSNLSPAQLDSVGKRMTMRTVEKGEVILRQGEIAETFYIIVAGQVKVYMSDEPDSRREVIVSTLGAGDFFGEVSLLDQEPRTANVAALERTYLQTLSFATFQEIIGQSPDIARKVMATMAARLRHADRQIGTLALMNISSRVSRTLLELAIMSNGQRVVGEPFTQKDLAGMVGASREMVNRTLKALTDGGYIAVHRKSITILNENLPIGY
ncbi:MAG: Crp/Fnr family transcriptional regulator [Betaproteobacteria bacterium]